MKSMLLRCLLLVAAMGYFFAELHTAKHLHLAGHAELSSHHGTLPISDADTPDQTESDDCLICTIHSHTVAILPPLDLPGDTLIVKTSPPRCSAGHPYPIRHVSTLGARAPPIV